MITTIEVHRSKSKTESPLPVVGSSCASTPFMELATSVAGVAPPSRSIASTLAKLPAESGSPIIFASPNSSGCSLLSPMSLIDDGKIA